MKTFRFTYECEAEDIERAYEIAKDNVGCFDCEEIDDDGPMGLMEIPKIVWPSDVSKKGKS